MPSSTARAYGNWQRLQRRRGRAMGACVGASSVRRSDSGRRRSGGGGGARVQNALHNPAAYPLIMPADTHTQTMHPPHTHTQRAAKRACAGRRSCTAALRRLLSHSAASVGDARLRPATRSTQPPTLREFGPPSALNLAPLNPHGVQAFQTACSARQTPPLGAVSATYPPPPRPTQSARRQRRSCS